MRSKISVSLQNLRKNVLFQNLAKFAKFNLIKTKEMAYMLIKKSISIILTLALISTTLHCSATNNIVPVNGGGTGGTVQSAVPVTKTTFDAQKTSGGFSLQSMKAKIDEVINPQKSKADPREIRSRSNEDKTELRDNPSGKCGDTCSWSLDTSTGAITISGTGKMDNYPDSVPTPWANYKSSIESVIINDGITSIGQYAFSSCSKLKSVTIPASVKDINKRAFQYDSNLNEINVNKNNSNYTSIDGVLFTKDKKQLIIYPAGIPNSTYVIPDGTTKVWTDAFTSCKNLKSITIPASCIDFPGGAISEGTTNLENITVDENNPNYKIVDEILFTKDDQTLVRCPPQKVFDKNEYGEYEIPDSVTTVDGYAFQNCKKLIRIQIGKLISSLNYLPFQGCSNLNAFLVAIGNANFTEINGVLFSKDKEDKDKKHLIAYPIGSFGTSYEIPDNVITIAESAFARATNLTSVTGKDVKTIGRYAFRACSNLKTVKFSDSVEVINENAFISCESLESIDFLNSVTIISNNTFSNCKALKSVTIGENVKIIATSAFLNCSSLASLYLGNNITSIATNAFSGCTALTSLALSNDYEVSIFKSIFSSSQIEKLTLGNDITFIAPDTFSDCSKLASVTLDNNYTVSEFKHVLPYFQIKNITIGNKVTCIENNTFSNCSSLKAVIIPDSVTSIKSKAFYSCKVLSDVCYLGTSDPGKSSNEVFGACPKLAYVKVIENYIDDTFCGIKVSKSSESSSNPINPKEDLLTKIAIFLPIAIIGITAIIISIIFFKYKALKNTAAKSDGYMPLLNEDEIVDFPCDDHFKLPSLEIVTPLPGGPMPFIEEFEM